MRIVCLAWGSLIWKPGVLPVWGKWHPDGPMLPIEFAHVGDNAELATALCPDVPNSSAYWARLDVDEIDVARHLLRQREEIDADRVDGVGTVLVGQPPGTLLGSAEIHRWASSRDDIDAVVWTALPPRFAGTEGRVPSPNEAAVYLSKLTGQERRHAEDYVRRVPAEIRTANRDALERAMAF